MSCPPHPFTGGRQPAIAIVESFNESTGWATAREYGPIDGGADIMWHFHSTSFSSDSTFRWPLAGEQVTIVFNAAGHLLHVHGE